MQSRGQTHLLRQQAQVQSRGQALLALAQAEARGLMLLLLADPPYLTVLLLLMVPSSLDGVGWQGLSSLPRRVCVRTYVIDTAWVRI